VRKDNDDTVCTKVPQRLLISSERHVVDVSAAIADAVAATITTVQTAPFGVTATATAATARVRKQAGVVVAPPLRKRYVAPRRGCTRAEVARDVCPAVSFVSYARAHQRIAQHDDVAARPRMHGAAETPEAVHDCSIGSISTRSGMHFCAVATKAVLAPNDKQYRKGQSRRNEDIRDYELFRNSKRP